MPPAKTCLALANQGLAMIPAMMATRPQIVSKTTQIWTMVHLFHTRLM
mgnify:FL=1